MAELREGQTGTAPDGTRVVVRGGQVVPMGGSASGTAPGARLLPQAATGDRRSEEAYWGRRRTAGDPAVTQAEQGVAASRRAEGLLRRQEAEGGMFGGTGGIYAVPVVGQVAGLLDPEIRELDAIQARQSRLERQPGEGAISDFDAAQFVAMTYGKDKPMETNRALIQAQRVVNDATLQKREFEEWFYNRFNTTAGIQEAWRTYAQENPIFDPAAQQNGGEPQINGSRKTWREYFAGEPGLQTQAEIDARAASSPGVGPMGENGLPTYPGITAQISGMNGGQGPTEMGPPPAPQGPQGPQGGEPIDIAGMSANDLMALQPGQQVRFPDGRVETLSGAPRVGAGGREVSPGVFAEEQTPAETVEDRRDMNGVARRIDAGVRGAADTLTFGLADEITAGLNTIAPLDPGTRSGFQDGFGEAYRNNVAQARAVDRADAQDVPVSRGVGQVAGGLVPGAVLARGAARAARPVGQQMARGSALGAAYGGAYGFGSGQGDAVERAPNALVGATAGAAVGAAAAPVANALANRVAAPAVNALQSVGRFAGRQVGRATGNTALVERASPNPLQSGIDRFASRAPQDVNALNANAARFRAEEIEPTFADAVNDGGRGAMRALATRQTPARQAAREFADGRATGLQDRVSTQARRTVSADPRQPGEIRSEITTRRNAQADQQFGAVRNETVTPDEAVVAALRAPATRTAIEDAATEAANFGDIETANLLRQLTGEALDNPSGVQITVGMSDRLARTLNGRAEAAQRSGNNTQAASLFSLAERLRGTARQQVPGYDEALKAYAQDSGLASATELGEQFTRMEADQFASQAARLSPDERTVAQASARRAIERDAGTQGQAPGVAARLAGGREQGMRSTALLDNPEAMQRGMRTELEALRNAQAVNPGQGSQTSMNLQDAGNAAGLIGGVRDAATGNLGGVIARIATGIKSRGFSDQEAEALVQAAIDPQQTDQIIAMLAQRMSRREARNLARAIRYQVTTSLQSGQPN